MRTLNLELLRTFLVVAEQRSMTEAAKRLHLTQGAVSQQIKRLEETFGGSLLVRDRRGIRLDPLGERLLVKTRQILALNDEIWADIKGVAVRGSVRLGVPQDLMGAWAAPALKSFVEANPHVELLLKCGSSNELKECILGGSLDLAIVEEPVGDASGECLSIERLVWTGAEGGTAFLKNPLPVSMVSDTCAFRSQVTAALDRENRPWKTLYENGSLDATVAMVSHDLAVSVWLKSAVPAGLHVLTEEAHLPDLPQFAISLHRSRDCESAAVNELVQHIRRFL